MLVCPTCRHQIPSASRYCPACGAALAGATGEQTGTYQPDSAPAAPPGSSPASDAFPPGQVLAGRYRVVSRLGKGGMGEVYRADDLKLGQAVALKFLPAGLINDPQRLALFHEEVRLARQVSHPNVCRVYDIAEWQAEDDGPTQPFLCMEFVDGEDLASLLRRIGRLPPDKGLQIARQLCLGLAAAQDRGILHRDLKPANVMLDGRGQVRITDFGLARAAAQVTGHDARSGTPAYMAPEQLAGREATGASDLYALGLVLYEVFTGKKPFAANSRAELMRVHEQSPPPSPSSRITDLDPAVERVILRCLAREPKDRPRSAYEVVAALPGGDPLAAARAAGETPAPELVARAGGEGSVRPAIALACMASVALGLVGALLLADRTSLVSRHALEKSPAVLENDAREMLKRLGYADPPRDHAFGFGRDDEYLEWVGEHDASPARWEGLGVDQPAGIYVWYRQSPRLLVASWFIDTALHPRHEQRPGIVSLANPPATVPGMVSLRLTPNGRLVRFEAISASGVELSPSSDTLPGKSPLWTALFREAGFDLPADSRWEVVKREWDPPVIHDAKELWRARGVYAGRPDTEIWVEAAAYRGKPVYFRIRGDWTQKEAAAEPPIGVFLVFLAGTLLLAAGVLAVRNWRRGRGDSRGAFRLGLFVFLVQMVVWLLQTHHVASQREMSLFTQGVSQSLFNATILWLSYLALEPYARRFWPEALISWSRLLAGRFRDPMVGRDLLVGCGGGVLSFLLLEQTLQFLVPPLIGMSRPIPAPVRLLNLDSLQAGQWPRYVLEAQVQALGGTLFAIFLLFLILRIVFRRQWLAVGVYLAFIVVGGALNQSLLFALANGLLIGLFLFILLRFGLLALTFTVFVHFLLAAHYALTAHFSAWYAGPGVWTAGLILALACYGCYTSLGDQPLLGKSWLGDEDA